MGIDIGADGAYAVFVNEELKGYGKMPNVEGELHMGVLMDKIMSYMPEFENNNVHVVFEDLHSIFGTSAASNFSFGLNNGLVTGMLQTAGIPYTKVQAKKWQKEMFEGIRPVEVPAMEKKQKGIPAVQKRDKNGNLKYKIDTKATALVAAKRLFPKETFLPTERSKVPHDGIVDAVLIGLYCSRHF